MFAGVLIAVLASGSHSSSGGAYNGTPGAPHEEDKPVDKVLETECTADVSAFGAQTKVRVSFER